MDRNLPLRAITGMAFVLTVGITLFSWSWTSRYSAATARHERELQSLQLHHDELEYLMLNIRTLLFMNPEAFGRSRQGLERSAARHGIVLDFGSSQNLESPERARVRELSDDYWQNQGYGSLERRSSGQRLSADQADKEESRHGTP